MPDDPADTAPDIIVDLTVEHDAWTTVADLEALVSRAVRAAVRHSGASVDPAAELSLVLCDDAFIQGLNRAWRGKDSPTNVLSFPTDEPLLLGDIVVAYETAAREAEAEGKTLADHLAHLVVHGVLHLLGHDHADDSEADAMEGLEDRVLSTLGIASPYRETAHLDEKDRRARP